MEGDSWRGGQLTPPLEASGSAARLSLPKVVPIP